jgi:hypothetical protein
MTTDSGSVGGARCGSVRRVTPISTVGGGNTTIDVAQPSTGKKRHSDSASKLDGERRTADGFGYQRVANLSPSNDGCLELGRESGASSFGQGAPDRPDRDVGPYPRACGDGRRPRGYRPMARLPGGRTPPTGGLRRRERSMSSGPLPILFHNEIKSPDIELIAGK